MLTLQEWFDCLPAAKRVPWTISTMYDEAQRRKYIGSKRTFYRLFERSIDELTIKEVNLIGEILGEKPLSIDPIK